MQVMIGYVYLQVVIIIDPSSKEDMEFWEKHNSEVSSMAKSSKVCYPHASLLTSTTVTTKMLCTY